MTRTIVARARRLGPRCGCRGCAVDEWVVREVKGVSVPEKLVEAVTDAVVAEWALFRAPKSGGTELVRSEYKEVVRTAVAAALAADAQTIPAAQLRAVIALIGDEDMTPTARRMLESVCEEAS